MPVMHINNLSNTNFNIVDMLKPVNSEECLDFIIILRMFPIPNFGLGEVVYSSYGLWVDIAAFLNDVSFTNLSKIISQFISSYHFSQFISIKNKNKTTWFNM